MEKDFLLSLRQELNAGKSLALATIIEQHGSAPRGVGSQLLADATGLLAGSVGGGLVEARTLQLCAQVLAQQCATVLELRMDNDDAAQAGMVCGGQVRVLVEPITPDAGTLAFFDAVAQAFAQGVGLFVVPLPDLGQRGGRPGHSLLLGQERVGAVLSDLVVEAAQRFCTASAQIVRVEGVSYFVQPLLSPWRLLLAGGGHVSRPTAEIAALAGFEVHVLDDRPEFAQALRFPRAASCRVVPDFVQCFPEGSVNERTCIVIVTRGHAHDGQVLRQALQSPASYVGMIGSVRKREALYAQLRAQGVAAEALTRVHCPVGLPIGAETPEEIAVSIVGQCIAHARRK